MTLMLSSASAELSEQNPVRVLGGGRTGGYPAHRHEFIELVVIAEGRGVHLSDGKPIHLTAGDILLFRPGAWHAYERCSGLKMWDCNFLPGLLDRELAWLMHDPGCSELLWRGPLSNPAGFAHVRVDAARLSDCVAALIRLRDLGPGEHHRLTRIGMLVELFGAVTAGIASSTSRRATSTVAQRAVQLLSEHPAHPWTTAGLALRLGVDVAYLCRVMRGVTGLPPMAYLARLRAERAAALLVGSDLPIGAIGSTVGWADPVSFARRFKAHFGVSASVYRQRSRSSPFPQGRNGS